MTLSSINNQALRCFSRKATQEALITRSYELTCPIILHYRFINLNVEHNQHCIEVPKTTVSPAVCTNYTS